VVRRIVCLLMCWLAASPALVVGAERSDAATKKKPPSAAGAKAAAADSIESLVKRTMASVVVIRGSGRDGKQDGLGSGFIIDADGLIATNLHVIGEGRSFVIETADGRKLTPTAIHASDRDLDLAIVRVDAKKLPALPLGDSDDVESGRDVIALGNPQGLEHSVVKGVVSGSREIDGLPLLQLAIPIEPGNSGGPVLDRQGRVLGVVTMKSAVTDNLGFAVKINAMKPLLAKPNTITMARWLTIGAIDPRKWEPLYGAKWHQRAGRIQVSGVGPGFGGRSLCLSKQEPPAVPFELAVSVKLGDESGAAGLAFSSDGRDRHYGFYPTNGRLRLTRFDGSDVYSWSVLDEKPSEAYVPHDWNRLKIRVEKDKVRCFVNGTLVFEHETGDPAGTRVGLTKFRATEAEFKEFAVATKLVDPTPSKQLLDQFAALRKSLPEHGAVSPALVDPLAKSGTAATLLLRDQAKRLDREAEQLRALAEMLHRRRTVDELAAQFIKPDRDVDLLRAALLVARLDNEEIDVDSYLEETARMADEVRGRLKKGADENDKLAALNTYLFEENGFHGSRRDYYSRSNSYLNEVIDDREGLPITLSVLYVEVGRRLGLPLAGVGLPGHFVAALVGEDNQVRRYLDPYESGKSLTEEEASARSLEITGRTPEYEHLQPTTKRAIVLRILENLLSLAGKESSRSRMAAYLDAILVIAPEHVERRMMRAMLRYQGGSLDEALADVDYLLEKHRDDVDEAKILELRERLERERGKE
jgi:serine protease Do